MNYLKLQEYNLSIAFGIDYLIENNPSCINLLSKTIFYKSRKYLVVNDLENDSTSTDQFLQMYIEHSKTENEYAKTFDFLNLEIPMSLFILPKEKILSH